MSLLLTRYVDEYCINPPEGACRPFRPERLSPGRLEPLADQLAVKTIMLDHQYPLHARTSP